MGTIVESQILKENKKCHILHFRTDKEWHRRSALLEIVLNNSETQMKTVPGARKIMAQVSVCSLHFYIIWVQYSFCFTFYSVLKPSFFFFFWSSSCLRPGTWSPFQLLLHLSPSRAPGVPLCSSCTAAALPAVSTLSSAGNILPPYPGVADSFLSFRF